MIRQDLNDSLDVLERVNGTFVGRLVVNAVRNAKYPVVWQPLVDRYSKMVAIKREPGNSIDLYCDLACTLITKKVMMADIVYLYKWGVEEAPESEEFVQLCEVHMITATKYLAKLLNCVYECVHGRLPDNAMRAAAVLYARLYGEAFDPESLWEFKVFDLVEKWFEEYVTRPRHVDSFLNVAPGPPFLVYSHVYWLWLHMTAARVRLSDPDLVTIVYALDTIIPCDECRKHFLEIRSDFFTDYRDGGDLTTCASEYGNAELLFHLHNRVNASTGSAEMDPAVLKEYEDYWEE